VSRNSLPDNLAFVGQDAFLFRGTIRENIALGRTKATEAEVVAAAKAAYAHEFITRFPAGDDTQVGENGKQLSGGQRQRVSVALIRHNCPVRWMMRASSTRSFAISSSNRFLPTTCMLP
jgi:ABC-type multidrug transport system fused ATPase/permease subunit